MMQQPHHLYSNAVIDDIPCGRRRSFRGARQARDRTVSEPPPAPAVHSGIASLLPTPVAERCIRLVPSRPTLFCLFVAFWRRVGDLVILFDFGTIELYRYHSFLAYHVTVWVGVPLLADCLGIHEVSTVVLGACAVKMTRFANEHRRQFLERGTHIFHASRLSINALSCVAQQNTKHRDLLIRAPTPTSGTLTRIPHRIRIIEHHPPFPVGQRLSAHTVYAIPVPPLHVKQQNIYSTLQQRKVDPFHASFSQRGQRSTDQKQNIEPHHACVALKPHSPFVRPGYFFASMNIK